MQTEPAVPKHYPIVYQSAKIVNSNCAQLLPKKCLIESFRELNIAVLFSCLQALRGNTGPQALHSDTHCNNSCRNIYFETTSFAWAKEYSSDRSETKFYSSRTSKWQSSRKKDLICKTVEKQLEGHQNKRENTRNTQVVRQRLQRNR